MLFSLVSAKGTSQDKDAGLEKLAQHVYTVVLQALRY